MASGFDHRLPQPLDCGNLAKEWPRWKQLFCIYLRANNKMKESEANKIATFLWMIGPRGVEIFNSLFPNNGSMESMFGQEEDAGAAAGDGGGDDAAEERFEDAQDQPATHTLAEILAAFDEYCLPRKNIAMEAFKFNSIAQKEKQTFAEFETELRTQVQYCEFNCATCHTPYSDRMLRDRIIIGIQDKKLQLKLLDGRDDPLSKIIETCKIFEAASENKQLLDRKGNLLEVKLVSKKEARKEELDSDVKTVDAVTRNRCYNCGRPFSQNHRRNCPASNAECHSCGEIGHFSKCCPKRTTKQPRNYQQPSKQDVKKNDKTVHSINWSDAGKLSGLDQVDDACAIECNEHVVNFYRVSSNSVCGRSGGSRPWRKVFRINDEKVQFKLDTGSDVNCIPLQIVERLNLPIDDFRDALILDYSSNKIKIHGKVKLVCVDSESGRSYGASFLVVDNSFEPLLGLQSCVEFELIKRLSAVEDHSALPRESQAFVECFRDIFEGLGRFPGKCSIALKENSVPSLHYRKRIPLALHDRLKLELERLVKEGVISPVDYPTDWVSNMQLVEKSNGKLRICLDPKPLNKCIKREHFLIPTQEDLFSRLSGKRVFSVLDLSSGFWQMELDRKSSDLTTFMTPFGRYRWNRVPFGLNNAPEMFQRRMVQIFGDIPGVVVYFDDVLIAGEDEIEHDKALAQVIERAQVNNVKFNADKLQYRRNKVTFMGSVIGYGEMHPIDKDVRAITRMPKPSCVADVARLLGLLKYLAKYIPNLSKRTVNLRRLTHHGAKWEWNEEHDMELNDLLSSISTTPTLAIYDPSKPCIVQTDSSKDGLGCVLLQDHGPVAYASRTLTNCEQKWAQIEKELLAVVFACQRFHHFLYGREFTVQSDHKPLETLVKRDIDDVTPRLQRMFLVLLKYPGLSILYTPGKDVAVADCLSRAPLPEVDESNPELENVVHSLTRNACMSKENYDRYLQTLASDERYMRIVKYVEQGWPSFHKLDDLSQLFYKYRDELHYENGLLFKNHRLVVPTVLQKLICKWLHAPHLGIEKTLARARTQFFWPGMSNDLTEVVSSCAICEKFRRNNCKEPLVQDDIPEYPFQRVSTDIYEYGGCDWLVVIDAYSGYICSDRLQDKTMASVCKLFDKFFNCYGYPTLVRSDNVPFNSLECERYANRNNIRFEFSSPRYPQSNGLAEKGVAIAKNILKRCYEVGEIDQFQYRLLEYNTTPVASMKLSPSQLFFGRQLKTRLPMDETLLIRELLDERVVRDRIEKKRDLQKQYYDRSAKQLPMLKVGERVLFKKNSKEWHYGQIVRDVNGGSYVIKDNFENHFRRNRRFITQTTNNDLNSSDLLVEDDPPKHQYFSEPKPLCHPENLDFNEGSLENSGSGEILDRRSGNAGTNESLLCHEVPDSSSGSSSQVSHDPLQSLDSSQDASSSVVSPSISPRVTRTGRKVIPPKRYGEWVV